MARDITKRKEPEEVLHASEKRLRTVVEQSPLAIHIFALDGRSLLANASWNKLWNLQQGEEPEDTNIFEDEQIRAAGLTAYIEDSVVDSRPVNTPPLLYEPAKIGRKGSPRWLQVSVYPVRDDAGTVTEMVLTIEDATERKWSEEALRKSEESLAEAQRIARLGSWEWDVITGEVSWSDETYQIYGYAPGEFTPTVDKLMEIVHPDDRNLVRKNIDAAIHESEPYDFEHRIVRPDGEERVIHRQAEIVFDEGGEALRMIGTVHDITERRRAEGKLKESEGRFRSLIQNSSDITTILEEDGTISYKSPAVERVLGYGQEEMLGERVFDYVHPEDVEYVRRTFAANLESPGANPPVQFRFRHADGSWRHMEAIRNNLLDDPNVRGIIVNTRDITERKEAEKTLKESEERYRAVVKQTAEAIFLVDGETKRIQEYNAKFQELLGYTPEDLREITLYEIVDHSRESVDSNIRNVLEKKEHSIGERTYRRKDGSLADLEVNANRISYDGREVMCIVARDITERKQAEEKLRESEERHRAVIEQSVEGIYLFNPDDGRVLESNEAFEDLLGYTSQELLGMTIYDFIAHEREDINRNVQRDYRERQRHKGERKYRRKDGSLLEVEASAAVIPYRDEEALCCVLHDITERKALEEQLRHQAFHDPLTELPNRALFLDRLGHALTRARQESGPVAVLLMDLNDFKVINDSLGHDAGNAVLIEIAKCLRSCVRPGDTPGRIFGDEFAVLLEAPAGMEEARRVAERIQEGLQKPFDVDGQEVFVSSSIGITLSDPIDEPKEALRHADLAMYEAKSRKAQYEVYEPSMDTRVVNRMDLERDLRRALESEQFEVHYQPVIELETGEVAGFEALARWRHPERGLVAAEEFIHLAEETGLIRPIGKLVLEGACRQGKEWRERYPDKAPLMSVNLSASQFSRQPDLIPKILNETGLEPSALQLEITERAVMDDAEFSIGKLKKLKGQGVSFAIDDYGMGYSCLYYLKRMPVDYLKIDRSFIAGLGEDPGDEAIVSGTIGLAHALGLKVVAEGVEAEEQLAKLKELGCDLAQGYHCGEPLPSEAAEKLL